jgi:hypothetical protein
VNNLRVQVVQERSSMIERSAHDFREVTLLTGLRTYALVAVVQGYATTGAARLGDTRMCAIHHVHSLDGLSQDVEFVIVNQNLGGEKLNQMSDIDTLSSKLQADIVRILLQLGNSVPKASQCRESEINQCIVDRKKHCSISNGNFISQLRKTSNNKLLENRQLKYLSVLNVSYMTLMLKPATATH